MRKRSPLRSERPRQTRICLFIALLSIAASCYAGSSPSDFPSFMNTAKTVFTGKGDDFTMYAVLHAEYQTLPPADRKQAGQFLSMIDAMFGRYDDAGRHYADSFPAKAPIECPSPPFQKTPIEDSIAAIAGNSRVLLVNESHSNVETRASIIRALPALRRAGYTHVAMEALNPASPDAITQGSGATGGDYLHDNVKAGFYLREPVYAQMVEEAHRLGYGLVAYESERTWDDQREAQQAANLKRWLDANPGARVVVVAGYSHIWKSDGWMAERLAASGVKSTVAVDQIDGLRGCRGPENQRTPVLWMTRQQHAWSSQPARVDATVTWRPGRDRGGVSSWLTLGGRRMAVSIPQPCQGKRPCLLEARHVGADGRVPEDRLVLFRVVENAVLYLSPGKYVVLARTSDETKRTTLEVVQHGAAH